MYRRTRKVKGTRMVVLTLKDKAAAVLQDEEAYQQLLDIAACVNVREGIRQGLEEARKGKTQPVRDFFGRFEAEHGLSG
jgi:hypothetical protein